MILQTPLVNSIKEDTLPQDGDSNITLPALILPSIELGLPYQSGFSSTVGGGFSPTQIMRVTSMFGFSCFQTNVGQSTTIIGACSPGQWSIDVQAAVNVLAPAALYTPSVNIGFDPAGAVETSGLLVFTSSAGAPNTAGGRRILVSMQRNWFLSVLLPAVAAGVTITLVGSVYCRRLA